MKIPFNIDIWYFKATGKLYVSESVTREFTSVGPEGHPTCYMNDVVDWVKDLRVRGELPGLQSGKWEHYILVNCEDGYPCLILPLEHN